MFSLGIHDQPALFRDGSTHNTLPGIEVLQVSQCPAGEMRVNEGRRLAEFDDSHRVVTINQYARGQSHE